MSSVNTETPPTLSICIIIDVPERGSPDTMVTKLDALAVTAILVVLLGSREVEVQGADLGAV